MSFLKAFSAETAPLQAASGTVKTIAGEKNYSRGRSVGTWLYGAVNGFSPFPPMFVLFPVKIALFVVFTLMFIFIFRDGVGKSLLYGYLAQAIIIMVASEWILDKFLSIFVGV